MQVPSRNARRIVGVIRANTMPSTDIVHFEHQVVGFSKRKVRGYGDNMEYAVGAEEVESASNDSVFSNFEGKYRLRILLYHNDKTCDISCGGLIFALCLSHFIFTESKLLRWMLCFQYSLVN